MLHKFCMIIGSYSQKDLSLNLICDFSRTQTMKRNRKLHNTRGVRVFRPQAVEGQPYCEGAFFILTLKHSLSKQIFLAWQKKNLLSFRHFCTWQCIDLHYQQLKRDWFIVVVAQLDLYWVLFFCRSQWQRNIVERCSRHWQVVLCVPGQCWRPARLWQSEPFAVSKGTTSQSPMKL